MTTLNWQQRLFVEHYLNGAKQDAEKAARMAGYGRPKSAAAVLLGNSRVVAYLEEKLLKAGAMPPEEILARWSDVASFDATQFLEWTEGENRRGEPIENVAFDLKKLKRKGLGHVVKKMEVLPSGGVKLEFYDSHAAKESLAKVHGMYKERIEIEHINGEAASDRVLAIISGLTQLAGAIGTREVYGEPEPRSLCPPFERVPVEAGEASGLPDPEDDGCRGREDETINCDHPAKAREKHNDLVVLPDVVSGEESGQEGDPGVV